MHSDDGDEHPERGEVFGIGGTGSLFEPLPDVGVVAEYVPQRLAPALHEFYEQREGPNTDAKAGDVYRCELQVPDNANGSRSLSASNPSGGPAFERYVR
jgi:hypothetical protein